MMWVDSLSRQRQQQQQWDSLSVEEDPSTFFVFSLLVVECYREKLQTGLYGR